MQALTCHPAACTPGTPNLPPNVAPRVTARQPCALRPTCPVHCAPSTLRARCASRTAFYQARAFVATTDTTLPFYLFCGRTLHAAHCLRKADKTRCAAGAARGQGARYVPPPQQQMCRLLGRGQLLARLACPHTKHAPSPCTLADVLDQYIAVSPPLAPPPRPADVVEVMQALCSTDATRYLSDGVASRRGDRGKGWHHQVSGQAVREVRSRKDAAAALLNGVCGPVEEAVRKAGGTITSMRANAYDTGASMGAHSHEPDGDVLHVDEVVYEEPVMQPLELHLRWAPEATYVTLQLDENAWEVEVSALEFARCSVPCVALRCAVPIMRLSIGMALPQVDPCAAWVSTAIGAGERCIPGRSKRNTDLPVHQCALLPQTRGQPKHGVSAHGAPFMTFIWVGGAQRTAIGWCAALPTATCTA